MLWGSGRDWWRATGIGVDPYYFTYEAEKLGYHSQIILNGRILNDNMGAYIADKAVKQMILAGRRLKRRRWSFWA